MKIIAGFEHDFDRLVTRGKLQVINLQEIVGSIKKHAEQIESQELKTAVNQIEKKIDLISEMFFNIPKPESLEVTQLFCFQLRTVFRWEIVQWEYGIADKVTTELKEMRSHAQVLANLHGTKVRLVHVVGKSIRNEFKADEKSYKILGVYSPVTS